MNNNRSTFVTVVAWIFIVGSGFATLMSLMQNIMIHVMFNKDKFSQLPDDMPAGASFMFEYFQLIILAFLLICILMLVSSIGLLKRKNWARLVFIFILSLGILWSLASLILQAVFFSTMPEMSQSPEFQEFKAMQSIMQWFTAIISIGFAILFGWIIMRLLSSAIKQEFLQ
jgi:hypothetical protein